MNDTCKCVRIPAAKAQIQNLVHLYVIRNSNIMLTYTLLSMASKKTVIIVL